MVKAVEEDVGEDGEPGSADSRRAVDQDRRVLVVARRDLPRLQKIFVLFIQNQGTMYL